MYEQKKMTLYTYSLYTRGYSVVDISQSAISIALYQSIHFWTRHHSPLMELKVTLSTGPV